MGKSTNHLKQDQVAQSPLRPFRACADETRHQAPKEEPTFHGSSRRSKALSNLCESTINQVFTICIISSYLYLLMKSMKSLSFWFISPLNRKLIFPLSQVLEGQAIHFQRLLTVGHLRVVSVADGAGFERQRKKRMGRIRLGECTEKNCRLPIHQEIVSGCIRIENDRT